MNCGKSVFSRVARVCKNDQGGTRNQFILVFELLRAQNILFKKLHHKLHEFTIGIYSFNVCFFYIFYVNKQ